MLVAPSLTRARGAGLGQLTVYSEPSLSLPGTFRPPPSTKRRGEVSLLSPLSVQTQPGVRRTSVLRRPLFLPYSASRVIGVNRSVVAAAPPRLFLPSQTAMCSTADCMGGAPDRYCINMANGVDETPEGETIRGRRGVCTALAAVTYARSVESVVHGRLGRTSGGDLTADGCASGSKGMRDVLVCQNIGCAARRESAAQIASNSVRRLDRSVHGRK